MELVAGMVLEGRTPQHASRRMGMSSVERAVSVRTAGGEVRGNSAADGRDLEGSGERL